MGAPRDIVILGLSLRSSWGNGHATTYRALVDALVRRGDRVLFLERDQAWYAGNQDPVDMLPGRLALYDSLEQLDDLHARAVAAADLVIVGSYVPEGIAVGAWVQRTARNVTAFYDIDTPVTLARLERNDCDYLSPSLIPGYGLYLSFTGGPTLRRLQEQYGAPRALPLYCAVDPERYFPLDQEPAWDLGYMGTYSGDRQPVLDRLLLGPARGWPGGRFVVAGPMYPPQVAWPDNVQRIEHLPPADHRTFYARQRYTLNVTRADMVAAGWSPSVRLFEAAACATPIISDAWEGLDQLFRPGEEILIATGGADVSRWLRECNEDDRRAMGQRARRRVLAEHTAAHRAQAIHDYLELAASNGPGAPARRKTEHDFA